jgi:hypothetical protein
MTPSLELRKLKSEITSFECLNYEDLKYYTSKIGGHIKMISEKHPIGDGFFKTYIERMILKHISIVEDYIYHLNEYKGREEFLSKSLKYHFNCIIDSYTYALLAYQH